MIGVLSVVLFGFSMVDSQAPVPIPQVAAAHKFADKQEIHDQEHIKTHLDGQINLEDQMTPQQLQFHYFKLHDTNNDNMLDGIELIKAITHWHADDKNRENPSVANPKLTDNDLEDMIDSILRDDDFNRDGYIDYSEFIRSQSAK